MRLQTCQANTTASKAVKIPVHEASASFMLVSVSATAIARKVRLISDLVCSCPRSYAVSLNFLAMTNIGSQQLLQLLQLLQWSPLVLRFTTTTILHSWFI